MRWVNKRLKKLSDLDCLKVQSENELHNQIANFLTYALIDPGIDWETIETSNNSNNLSNQRKRKARGVKAGTPDILITYNPDLRGHLHFILRLEIKTKTGRLQRSQEERIPQLLSRGQFVEIVRSVEDVEATLRKYAIPCRGIIVT